MDKLSYAVGMSMASNLINSGLKEIDVKSFVQAFGEIMNGETGSMSPEEANQLIQNYFSKQQSKMLKDNFEQAAKFLSENMVREGVVVLPSGLQYEILVDGDGAKPKLSDRVKCHYQGRLIDGTTFDSSIERGEPALFDLNRVIKGWIEALQLMAVGSKWRLFIPPDLAYGEQGAGGRIEPNSALIFDIELLGIE